MLVSSIAKLTAVKPVNNNYLVQNTFNGDKMSVQNAQQQNTISNGINTNISNTLNDTSCGTNFNVLA